MKTADPEAPGADAAIPSRVTDDPPAAPEASEHPPVVEPAVAPLPIDALAHLDRLVPPLQVIAAATVVATLWWAQAVLIPIVLSLLISYALEPVIVRLVSWRVPRSLAVPLLLAMVVTAVLSGAYALRGEALAFIDGIPNAAHTVAQAINVTRTGAPSTVSRVQAAARELEAAAGNATSQPKAAGVTPVRIEEPTFRWTDWLWQGSRSAFEFSAQMFVVVCLVYYLLAAGDLYRRKLVRIVPTLTNKKMTVTILGEIDRQIERFLLARLVISGVIAVLMWTSFRLLGVQEPGVWALLAAMLFAIPIVGPFIIVIGAAIAGFVQFGSLTMAAALGAVCTVIGAFEGNVLTPWLMSRVGEMNAVAVFVSLLFWGWIWGIWGLLLAVPITAAIKAACERIDGLHAFSEFLSA